MVAKQKRLAISEVGAWYPWRKQGVPKMIVVKVREVLVGFVVGHVVNHSGVSHARVMRGSRVGLHGQRTNKKNRRIQNNSALT
jgi:hypothetical protein